MSTNLPAGTRRSHHGRYGPVKPKGEGGVRGGKGEDGGGVQAAACSVHAPWLRAVRACSAKRRGRGQKRMPLYQVACMLWTWLPAGLSAQAGSSSRWINTLAAASNRLRRSP